MLGGKSAVAGCEDHPGDRMKATFAAETTELPSHGSRRCDGQIRCRYEEWEQDLAGMQMRLVREEGGGGGV